MFQRLLGEVGGGFVFEMEVKESVHVPVVEVGARDPLLCYVVFQLEVTAVVLGQMVSTVFRVTGDDDAVPPCF